MKRLILLLVCISHLAFAQDEDFDQYIYNLKTINPAFTGIVNEQNFDFQWLSSFDRDDAKTMLIGYSNKIDKINSGVGLIFASSKNSFVTNTKTSLLYNYQFKLNGKNKLSVGTELKHLRQSFDFSDLEFNPQDPVIIESMYSSTSNIDLHLGVLYQIKDLYVSLGSDNLLQTHPASGSGLEKQNTRTISVFVMNEFRFNRIKFAPSLLYRVNFENSWMLDINATLEINKWVLLGSILRIDDEGQAFPVINVGLNVKDKVQIISSIYNGYRTQQTNIGNAIELMLKAKIKNE
ncbi:MAG: PorP/SprF family type IX secretion system membrane protein [Chryseolinea sp.]